MYVLAPFFSTPHVSKPHELDDRLHYYLSHVPNAFERMQLVAALIHPKAGAEAAAGGQEQLLSQLQEHCRQELAGYSVPRRWLLLEDPLPRNAMGKVNKKELLAQFFSQ